MTGHTRTTGHNDTASHMHIKAQAIETHHITHQLYSPSFVNHTAHAHFHTPPTNYPHTYATVRHTHHPPPRPNLHTDLTRFPPCAAHAPSRIPPPCPEPQAPGISLCHTPSPHFPSHSTPGRSIKASPRSSSWQEAQRTRTMGGGGGSTWKQSHAFGITQAPGTMEYFMSCWNWSF